MRTIVNFLVATLINLVIIGALIGHHFLYPENVVLSNTVKFIPIFYTVLLFAAVLYLLLITAGYFAIRNSNAIEKTKLKESLEKGYRTLTNPFYKIYGVVLAVIILTLLIITGHFITSGIYLAGAMLMWASVKIFIATYKVCEVN